MLCRFEGSTCCGFIATCKWAIALPQHNIVLAAWCWEGFRRSLSAAVEFGSSVAIPCNPYIVQSSSRTFIDLVVVTLHPKSGLLIFSWLLSTFYFLYSLALSPSYWMSPSSHVVPPIVAVFAGSFLGIHQRPYGPWDTFPWPHCTPNWNSSTYLYPGTTPGLYMNPWTCS